MAKETLLQKIKNKTAVVAVAGVGYVGLPVCLLTAEAGFTVYGRRRDEEKIKKLDKGINIFEGNEPGLSELLKKMHDTGRLHFTTDPKVYSKADIVIIAVDTPVDPSDHKPRYAALRQAVQEIGESLGEGEKMVSIESTVSPGTADNLVRPLLEKYSGKKEGEDLFVVNCPERVMPGFLLKKLRHHSRVVGAADRKTANMAKLFYRNIVAHEPKQKEHQWRGEIDVAPNIVAEIVKTAENAHRDVQIAFANELAWVCESYGADFWHVRELVRKSPGRNIHEAGAGVGGHCIPKDSWLLLAGLEKQDYPESVIAGARHLNDYGPRHVWELVKEAAKENGISIRNSKIAVMGYAYREDSDDDRNSPTQDLIDIAKKSGATLEVHDPFVASLKKTSLTGTLKGASIAIFMVAHKQYIELPEEKLAQLLKQPKIVIDGRHIYNRDSMEEAGIDYYGVGDIIK